MSEPTWKRLADQIKAERLGGYQARVQQILPSGGANGLAAEIIQEMAAALRRSEDKVLNAIQACQAEGRKIDALNAAPSCDQEELQWRLGEHERLRAAAETALWELRVHREALGFVRNEDLAELYPIPPRRRTSGR